MRLLPAQNLASQFLLDGRKVGLIPFYDPTEDRIDVEVIITPEEEPGVEQFTEYLKIHEDFGCSVFLKEGSVRFK